MSEEKEKEKRRIWTAKQKSEVVLEGLKEKETVAEVCRRYGISQSMYYSYSENSAEIYILRF